MWSAGLADADNIEKMKNLSNVRLSELRICLETTYCIWQNWVTTQHTTIIEILNST